MFNNIGGKIKGLATFICWLGIIGSVLGGIALVMILGDEMSIVVGIIVAIVGSLLSWIGSFLLYGFGQLIYNSDIIVKNIRNNKNKPQPSQYVKVRNDTFDKSTASQRKCEGCGNVISKEICPHCGRIFGVTAEKLNQLQASYTRGEMTEHEYLAKVVDIRNQAQ